MVYHEFVESCFSHSTEKIRRRTLCLSESFWYRKFWRIRGGYHCLPSKIFCLTVPDNFVKEQLCVSEQFWYRKFLCRRGGSRFCVGSFMSHSTKNFRGGPVCFRKFQDWKNCIRSRYHDFVENWFSHSTKKFRRRTLHSSEKFFYRKFLWIGRGYHNFLWKFFVSVPKKVVGGLFCFRKFLDQKKSIRWCITNLSKVVFLTVQKIFVGGLSVFQKNSGIWNFEG